MSETPVITQGAFDSQNLAFWDLMRGEYRAYFRSVVDGQRGILTATSQDFLHWTQPVPLTYPGVLEEQLYTNQIKPYPAAPHLYIGFPTRYIDRGWSDSTEALPGLDDRRLRAGARPRYGGAVTEALLMTSRDGHTFKRWPEAFLRPGLERLDTWAYGDHFIAWHAVETRSGMRGAPNELSLYATEAYWTGNRNQLRRYTLRRDGFVSVRATMEGGELITKPLVFEGQRLVLNFSSAAAGGIRVEIQEADGSPIDGFSLSECSQIYGDTLEGPVRWKQGREVGRLAGKPIRLRFQLQDADLYAFRFR